MKQLPDKLKLAVARYYVSRAAANRGVVDELWNKLAFYVIGSSTIRSRNYAMEPEFKKDEARDRIGKVAAKYGINFQAVGGTMFFHKKLRSGNHVQFEVNEFDWIDSGKRSIVKKRKVGAQ